jgi:putative tributyrin esterase
LFATKLINNFITGIHAVVFNTFVLMKKLLFWVFILLSSQLFAQEQLIYKSKNLAKPDTVWVFKPTNKGRVAPLIFLLHGWSGNYRDWSKAVDLQKYADDYGFTIVCPDGLYNSWYVNSPAVKNSQYEDFFIQELYPNVLKRYNVDRNHIFITGLSMGGHGALWLYINHQELFNGAGSTSGGIRLSDAIGKFGVPALLGNPPADSELWRKYSVYENIDKLKGNKKPIYFDCGSDDFFYQSNNLLKQKCDSLKLNATYLSQPGAHNWNYWKESIVQQMTFFAKQVVKN